DQLLDHGRRFLGPSLVVLDHRLDPDSADLPFGALLQLGQGELEAGLGRLAEGRVAAGHRTVDADHDLLVATPAATCTSESHECEGGQGDGQTQARTRRHRVSAGFRSWTAEPGARS